MSIRAAQLFVEIGADTKGAEQGIARVDQGVRGLGDVGKTALGVTLGGAILKAGSGLVGLGREALSTVSTFELMGASLTQLAAKELLTTGRAESMAEALEMSASAGEELFGWTQQLAIKSPFTTEGVANAYKMAMAYGFNTQEAKRLTEAMIDFAAGTGASEQTMSRIALALGQIRAKGKLAGGEVLQLTEAGLSVNEILATAFGKTTAEIVEMREKGLIPADQAIEAIIQNLEQNFAGAAERTGSTLTGLMNALGDLKAMRLADLFAPLFKTAQPYLEDFVETLQDPETIANIQAMGEEFAETVTEIVAGTKEVINWWGDLEEGTRNLAVALGAVVILRPTLVAAFTGMSSVVTGLAGAMGKVSAAWSAGLSLTTALSAGFGTAAVTAGALGLAIASLAAAYVTYQETVVKANREGTAAVAGALRGQLDALAAQGAGVEDMTGAVLNAWDVTEQNINKSWAGFAVDKTQIARAYLGELSQALLEQGVAYDVYRDKIISTAAAMGMDVELTKTRTLTAYGQTQVISEQTRTQDELIASLGGLTQAQYDAARSAEVEAEATEVAADAKKVDLLHTMQLAELNEELAELNEELAAAQGKLNEVYIKWNQTVAGDAVAALREAGIEGEAYKAALGGIDEVMGTNYLTQYNYAEELKAITEEYKKTGDIEAYKTKISELADTYRDELAEGIREAQAEVDILQNKIDNLTGKVVKITVLADFATPGGKMDIGVRELSEDRDLNGNGIIGKAAGGQVYSGGVYEWQERGRELFIPQSDGYVASAGQTTKLLTLLEQFLTAASRGFNQGGYQFNFYANNQLEIMAAAEQAVELIRQRQR